MQTSRPALIVSIHDVSPLTHASVVAILDDLASLGVCKTSLLVVPDHHHKAPIFENPPFCEWLRNQQFSGHELVMHGYFHQRPAGGTWAQSLVTEHYTKGEGEFFDLTQRAAAERLKKAQAEFARENFRTVGFIAPAWLLGDEAERAVCDAGFDYTTRLQNIKDLKSGAVCATQSLVWSVRAAWRRVVSLAWNSFLARRLASNPVLRVGLHPPDWEHPAIRAQVLRLIRAALASREAITYEEWLLRSRARS
ncbi:DUF2334 domain-containing protein [soil metagenome]